MVTRAEVNQIRGAVTRTSALAVNDLTIFFNSLDWSNPIACREALVEFLPRLVAVYGDTAGVAAAEWYERVRKDELGRHFYATTTEVVTPEQVRQNVRYASGSLFEENPERALSILRGAVDRHVQTAAQSVVAHNSVRDPRSSGWARVPSGTSTCAFCAMLASRGFTYTTEFEAQHRGRGATQNKFHDHCRCQVVPAWKGRRAAVDGYDPAELKRRYDESRKLTQDLGGDPNDPHMLLATMRRLFPDDYTDGVSHGWSSGAMKDLLV